MIDVRRQRDAERFVGNLQDLLARSLDAGPTQALRNINGTDSSGSVYCVVDLGGRLIQVGILPDWWTTLGLYGLGPAVLDALRFARDKAGLARAMLHHYGRSYPAGTPDYGMLFTSEPPIELPAYDAPDFDDVLRRKVSRAADVLANAQRVARQRDSGERREVAGPRRLFHVILSGVTVVGAFVDERHVGPGSAADLAVDARDALVAATPYMRMASI